MFLWEASSFGCGSHLAHLFDLTLKVLTFHQLWYLVIIIITIALFLVTALLLL